MVMVTSDGDAHRAREGTSLCYLRLPWLCGWQSNGSGKPNERKVVDDTATSEAQTREAIPIHQAVG